MSAASMKRIIQVLPLALAALWLLTSLVVLAIRPIRPARRASPRLPRATAPPPLLTPPALAAPLVEPPAPVAITVATVLVAGRPPPEASPRPRAATVEAAARAWRCGAWRPLASGPETQRVRSCE
jgi:hypothetical protein